MINEENYTELDVKVQKIVLDYESLAIDYNKKVVEKMEQATNFSAVNRAKMDYLKIDRELLNLSGEIFKLIELEMKNPDKEDSYLPLLYEYMSRIESIIDVKTELFIKMDQLKLDLIKKADKNNRLSPYKVDGEYFSNLYDMLTAYDSIGKKLDVLEYKVKKAKTVEQCNDLSLEIVRIKADLISAREQVPAKVELAMYCLEVLLDYLYAKSSSFRFDEKYKTDEKTLTTETYGKNQNCMDRCKLIEIYIKDKIAELEFNQSQPQ